MVVDASQEFTDIISGLKKNFFSNLDFNAIEKGLRDAFHELVDRNLLPILQTILDNRDWFLVSLKQLAAKLGMRFCGYRKTNVRIFTGHTLTILSPYFVKAKPKKRRGRKPRRAPNGTGRHLGLELLGFIERTSANLASNVIQMAILCPSFKVAQQVLHEQGIRLDVKTMQRLCKKFGNEAMLNRGMVSFEEPINLNDLTVLICVDGGRLRQRKRKRGCKPASLKRQGYHTDWVEPKLLTIQFLDQYGRLCKDIPPLYDATIENIDGFFELLYQYLKCLDLSSAEKIVFCADGAPGIWKRIPDLMGRLEITKWYEALDYTHAKQNLFEITDLIPRNLCKHKEKITSYWKELLWEGHFDELRESINILFRGKRLKKALNKFDNYFGKNRSRMQYSTFKANDLPIGSGAVESAIRRVINLRIKGAGIFWTREMAEAMLFLRSQFLCGRWSTVLKNIVSRTRQALSEFLPVRTSAYIKTAI